MTSKRKLSYKERRAASAISDALRAGSLRPTDHQGAAQLLSRTLPEVARLQKHALQHLASNALRQAVNTLPPEQLEQHYHQQHPPQTVPKANATSSPNSTDLLPSMRPRQTMATPSNNNTPVSAQIRKRRRTSRVPSNPFNPSNISPSDASPTSFVAPRPHERFDDIGGITPILDTLRELVDWPLSRRPIYDHLGIDPPRGILLHGPPGCGKTLLANAVAGEIGVSFLRLSAPEIVSGVSGESERKLRVIFQEAIKVQPSIIFIDEIDSIASSRESASKDMERRIVSQLLSCIDGLAIPQPESNNAKKKSKKNAQKLQIQKTAQENDDNKDKEENTASTEPEFSPETDLVDTEEHIATGIESTGHTTELEGERGVNDSTTSDVEKLPAVVVIAATNRPESLEPALRRAGRFDKEIELGAPDEEGRRAILGKLSRKLRLDDSFDVDIVAKRTAGYVGADLHLLVKEAGLACIRRIFKHFELTDSQENDIEENNDVNMGDCDMGSGNVFAQEEAELLEDVQNGDEDYQEDESLNVEEENATQDDPNPNVTDKNKTPDNNMDKRIVLAVLQKGSKMKELAVITMADFEDAVQRVQPSAMREGFTTKPNVSWDKIGSLEKVREEMIMAIVEPIRRPELFSSLGLNAAGGVLLYGPPGCGKTLLARAVASESGANFISVKGPELLSKYVGDSELAVRKLFARARCSSPCVIFFDELDALAARRGGGAGGGERDSSGASERVVNMLLTEMDGFNERKQVFLIAATNRPDIIDPAMLRPGRLDKLVFVPLPDGKGRISILNTLLKGVKIAEGEEGKVDVQSIAMDPRCEGFSGADLQALIRVAGEYALREIVFGPARSDKEGKKLESIRIEKRHFERALDTVGPSVSTRDAKSYQGMEKRLRKSRNHVESEESKK